VIRRDPDFRARFLAQKVEHYKLIVASIPRTLIDRDSVPGFEPEDLMRLDIPTLIVPGQDAAHALSAARFLEECSPKGTFWDIPVPDQTEATVPPRMMEFLAGA
jgi:hypothetical protein